MPDAILTANVGCQTHLATGAAVPVRHWVVDVHARLSAG
jgi:glycolate oxidase iron-sulfur subunit